MTLQDLRKNAGFRSQKEFAEAIEVQRERVAKWETGTATPNDLQIIFMIAKACGCTDSEVLRAFVESEQEAKNA